MTATLTEGDTGVIASFLAAHDAVPTALAATIIKPGDRVIAWNQGGMDLIWAKPSDTADPRFEQIAISFAGPSTLTTSVDRVAPADTPLGDPKDDRITIVNDKGAKVRDRAYWRAGDWCLMLPGHGVDWFKTKKDAIAAAVRRLAILDWHAAHPQTK